MPVMRPTALFISNLRWDFVWQRHQTMAALCAQDYDVVFCEIPGVRRPGWRDWSRLWARLKPAARPGPAAEPPPAGIRVVRPAVLPAVYPAFCRLNPRLLDRWLAGEPGLRAGVDLIVNYSPARTALQLIERVPHRQLVYDCTDDWLAVRGIPDFLPADEQRLLRLADLTLVPSRTLLARKQPGARRCVQLPHGALVERFLVPPRPPAAPDRLVLLYYGHLHRQHLDFALLDRIARERPGWRLLLVGPVKTPHKFPPNVTLTGQVPHGQLREHAAQADVILLPYVLNRYTEAVMPAKTYECLATGRPIVATLLPELVAELPRELNYPRAPEEWIPMIERAVATDSEAARAARIELAQANTWESRYRRFQQLLREISPPERVT
jgi:glycosyltransferase involved in cell wall biosynthesis